MGLLPRIKIWQATEDVTNTDLNAEFDNILNNLTPQYVNGWSTNTTQMRNVTSPGSVGSESLATSLSGEIERIRYVLKQITGNTQWYSAPASTISSLANSLGGGLTQNRIQSGRVLATSAQPAFLVPNGAAATVALKGATTNFVYYIGGTQYTISTDVSLTGLTTAPASNNTCTINDATASAQYWTQWTGEDGTDIPVTGMGSSISALVGQFAAFKLNNGSTNEYFIAYVKSSTVLSKAFRGYFFNSSDAAVPRITYSNGNTITLMKLTWVFAKTDGTLTATYNNPTWSYTSPSSPSIGDYWYDLQNNVWKTYTVGSWAAANALLIGVCAQDGTSTIAARSFDSFQNFSSINTAELSLVSNTQVAIRRPGAQVNVYGATVRFEHNIATWDMALNLESGVSNVASTYYYFYVTELGNVVISDKKPFDRREDLQGYYHPHNSWRCVGYAFNDASSHLTQVESYYRMSEGRTVRSAIAAGLAQPYEKNIVLSGASYSFTLPDASLCKGQEISLLHAGTSLSQVYTLATLNSQTIGGIAGGSYALYTNGESLRLLSDGSNWLIVSHYATTAWADFPSVAAGTLITGTTTNPTFGTISSNKAMWKREGQDYLLRWDFRQTTAGTAGSGFYVFNIPAAHGTINTSLIQTLGGAGSAWGVDNCLGDGDIFNSTGSIIGKIFPSITGTNTIAFVAWIGAGATSNNPWGSAYVPFSNTPLEVHLRMRLPMTGWQP